MRKLALLVLVAALPSTLSCNKRVFEVVQNSCQKTIQTVADVPTNKAADILIVVDNSGSMAEEQKNLVDNFLNQDPGECPLQDLQNIPAQFQNPTRDLYTNDGPLAKCGFIQLLAAFQSDFRVGVITSDVGLCDNRLPDQQGQIFCQQNPGSPECGQSDGGGWGFRPQRGCLQPAGPPGNTDKIISAEDLKDPTKQDLAGRFKAILDNIRTFGSPYERELDAAAIFLHQAPGVDPNPSCTDDFANWRRPDASLSVIFLSDENDCSHSLSGGTFPDELAGETCGAFTSFITPPNNPSNCYKTDPATGDENAAPELAPIDAYKKALLAADPKIKVAVIAGGLGTPGDISAAGCHVGPPPAEAPVGGDCRNSGGLSNFTNPGDPCDPSGTAQNGFAAGCCTADPGTRYFDLANSIGTNKDTDSICNGSFRSTMLDIAALIAAVDFVELAEPPVNPNAIVVQLTKAGSTDPQVITHLADDADCATQDGWKLEGDTRVDLCGAARPGPGDHISVLAEGAPLNGCQ